MGGHYSLTPACHVGPAASFPPSGGGQNHQHHSVVQSAPLRQEYAIWEFQMKIQRGMWAILLHKIHFSKSDLNVKKLINTF